VQGPDRIGRLIALEGIDGCGKSTQAARLAGALGALLTFEPGDTALGGSIRRLMLDFDAAVSPRAEALLMASDRAQHVDEVVGPALSRGRWVVTDRFSGSTLAYQGWGRGLGAEPLTPVLAFATNGLLPDLSILLDVPVAVARARITANAPDRLERMDADFHERVAGGYRELARTDPTVWAVVDGTASVEEVAQAVADEVSDRLGRPEELG
jgi:dTMP kinase